MQQMAKRLTGFTVLVVEDEPDNLDVARRLLTKLGATVLTAENGMEALSQLIHQPPDLIISDISMPQMDGWELIRTIRESEQWKAIPVVALTAHAMLGDREKAIAAGFTNFITKPFDLKRFPDDIIEMMKTIPNLAERLI